MISNICVPDGFDTERLNNLLSVMGDRGALLLDTALSDLSRVRASIGQERLFRDGCHTLAALAGTLGATRLGDLAAEGQRLADAGLPCDSSTIMRHLEDFQAYLIARKAVG